MQLGNLKNKMITLKKLLNTYKKTNLNYKLPIILGVNNSGKSEFADLVDLKHILMGGSTGSGKSILEETIISTLATFYTPEQLKFFLVDMKLVELQAYEGFPYLQASVNGFPTESVFHSLEVLIEEKNKRLSIKNDFNKYPYIIAIIDTFSDLMAFDSKKFQDIIVKLIDKASEVKIHVIMSDSRISPDLYTDQIVRLFPTKICFNVQDAEASKRIIGAGGGERLKGRGDMLFLPPGTKKPIRIQAPYISEGEINVIVEKNVK